MAELDDTTRAIDAAQIEVDNKPTDVTRKPYKVLAEAGLFKNGEHYLKGSTIQLTQRTADGFLALGEVEESE